MKTKRMGKIQASLRERNVHRITKLTMMITCGSDGHNQVGKKDWTTVYVASTSPRRDTRERIAFG